MNDLSQKKEKKIVGKFFVFEKDLGVGYTPLTPPLAGSFVALPETTVQYSKNVKTTTNNNSSLFALCFSLLPPLPPLTSPTAAHSTSYNNSNYLLINTTMALRAVLNKVR